MLWTFRSPLASYPQFIAGGGPYQVATTWGVTTMSFVRPIQVCGLWKRFFPRCVICFRQHSISEEMKSTRMTEESAECTKIMRRQNLKTYEDVQSYFIRQIDAYLSSKGKNSDRLDEIWGWIESECGRYVLARPLMEEYRLQNRNIKSFFTPGSHCYFDHYQSLSPMEPLAIGGYTTLEKFIPLIPSFKSSIRVSSFVLGSIGNVWTEYISTPEQVLYMSFSSGIAFIWSQLDATCQ